MDEKISEQRKQKDLFGIELTDCGVLPQIEVVRSLMRAEIRLSKADPVRTLLSPGGQKTSFN